MSSRQAPRIRPLLTADQLMVSALILAALAERFETVCPDRSPGLVDIADSYGSGDGPLAGGGISAKRHDHPTARERIELPEAREPLLFRKEDFS